MAPNESKVRSPRIQIKGKRNGSRASDRMSTGSNGRRTTKSQVKDFKSSKGAKGSSNRKIIKLSPPDLTDGLENVASDISPADYSLEAIKEINRFLGIVYNAIMEELSLMPGSKSKILTLQQIRSALGRQFLYGDVVTEDELASAQAQEPTVNFPVIKLRYAASLPARKMVSWALEQTANYIIENAYDLQYSLQEEEDLEEIDQYDVLEFFRTEPDFRMWADNLNFELEDLDEESPSRTSATPTSVGRASVSQVSVTPASVSRTLAKRRTSVSRTSKKVRFDDTATCPNSRSRSRSTSTQDSKKGVCHLAQGLERMSLSPDSSPNISVRAISSKTGQTRTVSPEEVQRISERSSGVSGLRSRRSRTSASSNIPVSSRSTKNDSRSTRKSSKNTRNGSRLSFIDRMSISSDGPVSSRNTRNGSRGTRNGSRHSFIDRMSISSDIYDEEPPSVDQSFAEEEFEFEDEFEDEFEEEEDEDQSFAEERTTVAVDVNQEEFGVSDIDLQRMACFLTKTENYIPHVTLPSGFNSFVYQICKDDENKSDDAPLLGCHYVVKIVALEDAAAAEDEFQEELEYSLQASRADVNATIYQSGVCDNPILSSKKNVPRRIGWILMDQIVGSRLSDTYPYDEFSVQEASSKYNLLTQSWDLAQHDFKGDNIIWGNSSISAAQNNLKRIYIIDYGTSQEYSALEENFLQQFVDKGRWLIGDPVPRSSSSSSGSSPSSGPPPGLSPSPSPSLGYSDENRDSDFSDNSRDTQPASIYTGRRTRESPAGRSRARRRSRSPGRGNSRRGATYRRDKGRSRFARTRARELRVTPRIQQQVIHRMHIKSVLELLIKSLTYEFSSYSSTKPDPWGQDPNKLQVLQNLITWLDDWYGVVFGVPEGRYVIRVSPRNLPDDIQAQYKRWQNNRGVYLDPWDEYW